MPIQQATPIFTTDISSLPQTDGLLDIVGSDNEVSDHDDDTNCEVCGVYFRSGYEYAEFLKSGKSVCEECKLFFSAMYRHGYENDVT